jgi:hypothetical protein
MPYEYTQRGIRGGVITGGKVSHGRDLWKSEQSRASEHPGPVYTPRGNTTSRRADRPQSATPFGSARKQHTRDLWKTHEEHAREVPSVGIYNPRVGVRGPEKKPNCTFGSARLSHGRDLWKTQEEHAREIPGTGLYTPRVTRRGPDRPQSAMSFGSARKQHSRNLWKTQEDHAREMPGVGQARARAHTHTAPAAPAPPALPAPAPADRAPRRPQYSHADITTIEARAGLSPGSPDRSVNRSVSVSSMRRPYSATSTPRSVPARAASARRP